MSGPDYYGPSAGYHNPPDQGYGQAYQPPGNGQYDSQYEQPHHARQRHEAGESAPPLHHSYDPNDGRPIPPGYVPPHQPPPSADDNYDQNYFPPPPRNEYDDYSDRGGRHESRSEYDRYDGQPQSNYNTDRPYAPSEPRPNEGNQLAPYDEEKAEANWRREWEEDQRQQQQRRNYGPPPPPSDYELGRYDSRRSHQSERDRRYDDRYYDYRQDDDRRSYEDDRDRRHRRRRDSRYDEAKSNTAMKNKPGPDIFGGKEGERGLGAQLLGGAAGGLLGHEMGGGILETLGGAALGAFGAKVLENQHEKSKAKKERQMKGAIAAAPYRDQALRGGASRGDDSGRRSPSYDRRDDRRGYDDYDDYDRNRPSPRNRSRGRRRSDEYDDYSPPPPRRSGTY